MHKYIVFIRGINGGLTLKMSSLRELFDNLGLRDSKTVLATGNIIFETAQSDKKILARQIEQAIDRVYNYQTVAVLYTEAELRLLIKADPFRGITSTSQRSHQVSFIQKGSGRLPFDLPHDVPQKGYKVICQVGDTICSLMDLSGATRPDLLAVLDRAFNKQVTTRNWKTVERCCQAMEKYGNEQSP
ncbi:MAG TPA: DUF1697 domain-containing protein [Magnetospirillaceae bacterium]|nr:DUF1697 domain-containing protein [Magnetospirillaceae bacterium]